MGENGNRHLFSTGSIIDGKWVLMERIGKGGMGEVYRAHQLNLRRDVAIKIISQELMEAFQDDPLEAQRAFKRLQREVQTMAQVHHPNVLQIFDFGQIEASEGGASPPMQYIVMEYIPGNTLRFTMSEDGLGEDAAALRQWLRGYFFPVLEAMGAVHAQEIVHRDIKPENVLLDGDTPKIADFGLARSVRIRAISDSWDVKGTMHYMAPEQFIDFRKVGPTADIYALGKILYEAVEGRIGPGTVPLKAVNLGNPADPFLQKIDEIVRKATAESPGARFQTVAEMQTALEEAVEASERSAKASASPRKWGPGQRITLLVAALALVSVLAMTAWHLAGNPPGGREPAIQQTPKAESGPPAEQIRGKDGKAMVLIGAQGGQAEDVPPFYMDREKVTYYDYVEFLNEVKDRVSVKEGIVENKDGRIWYYLGTGSEQNGQIFHEHDRFHLRDPENADRPVVRVSFFGAQAYARHYAKRLPTKAEWMQAAAWIEAQMPEGIPDPNAGRQKASEPAAGHMHMMTSQGDPAGGAENDSRQTMNLPLTDPMMHVREWAVAGGDENRPLVVSYRALTGAGKAEARYRSEGFSDVGFRTVIPVRSDGQ